MQLTRGKGCYLQPMPLTLQPIFINSESSDWVGIVAPGRVLAEEEARELFEAEGYDVADGALRPDGFLQVPVPLEHEGEFSSWWERVADADTGAQQGWVLEA